LNGAEEEDVDADGGCLVCDDSGSGFWKFATFIFFVVCFALFFLNCSRWKDGAMGIVGAIMGRAGEPGAD
jgi:hypothetical protein